MCQTISRSTKLKENKLFLGIFPKRYLQTYLGLLHAISSTTALVVGNYLFLRCILLGNLASDDGPTALFHVSSLLSGLTLLPLWDKVQSWQLSTTTMEQKGLSRRQMQNFNRGRGILAPILSATYPLLYRHLSDEILKDAVFSRAVGVAVVALALYQYTLIRDYGKPLFVVYGGTKLGYSLHLLWSGSLYSLREDYPYAVSYLEKEAIFIVCCVEFGFLWYYLHSRKLVTKELVQNACKRYHPILLYSFLVHIAKDKWWNRLPVSVSWVMFLSTLAGTIFFVKMIKALVGEAVTKSTKENNGKRSLLRRSSSVFDVQNSITGRRSSIFESITD